MEDYIILDYLKNKGVDNSYGILQRFKDYMAREGRYEHEHMSSYEDPYRMKRHYEDDWSRYGKPKTHPVHGTLDEQSAKEIISELYHYENGKKIEGEKFDMRKAKEVMDRYRSMIPSKVSVEEVYLAINTQYHDYCTLFKTWFGSTAEPKIIESAIVFWFRDEDSMKESKIIEYLMTR